MAPHKTASPPSLAEILLQTPDLWATPARLATKVLQEAHMDGGERLGYEVQHHKGKSLFTGMRCPVRTGTPRVWFTHSSYTFQGLR